MKVKNLHEWQVSVAQAFDIQLGLAARVSRINEIATVRFIAGVDSSVSQVREIATGAVVILSYPELRMVETKVVSGKPGFPYIPGLLSFRELPLILAACEKLEVTPDLILVDGQGVAHSRRLGLASHLGLLLDVLTIGCAKSLLCGSHEVPGTEAGNYTEIIDGDDTIGVALRTKTGVKPLYVSIGHRIDIKSAMQWVMGCCKGYRLPEPTRIAHLTAIKNWRDRSGLQALKKEERISAGT